jgi:dienelactone hydrolase
METSSGNTWTTYCHIQQKWIRVQHLYIGTTIIPCIIARPDISDRIPSVILVHGAVFSKEYMLPLCLDYAANGYLCVAFDGPVHGERGEKQGILGESGPDPLKVAKAASEASNDVSRILDHISGRDDVNGERIALVGSSMGGLTTLIAAAYDERIKVACPSLCSGNLVEWYSYSSANSIDEKVRKSLEKNDAMLLAERYPPKALLLQAGTDDEIFPFRYVKDTYEALLKAYKKAGCQERLKMKTYSFGHYLPREGDMETMQWITRWL